MQDNEDIGIIKRECIMASYQINYGGIYGSMINA